MMRCPNLVKSPVNSALKRCCLAEKHTGPCKSTVQQAAEQGFNTLFTDSEKKDTKDASAPDQTDSKPISRSDSGNHSGE